MKKDWPAVRLGEVLRLDLHQVPVQAGSAYPNVGIYSFGRGMFGKPDIDGAATSATTLYRIRAGQLIYSRLFAFEGAYALVPATFDGYFVSSEFPTFEIDSDRASLAYIGWLFRYPRIWGALSSSSTGMGDRRQRVHPEGILKYRIKLPSLGEQRCIVARIEELTDEIQEAINLCHGAAHEIEELLAAEERQIWPESLLEEALPLEHLTTFLARGKQSEQGESEHFLIKTQHVQQDHCLPTLLRLAPQAAAKVQPEAVVQEGDILIACSAAGCLGRVARYRADGRTVSTDTHVAIARPDGRVVNPDYLYAYLRGAQGQHQLRSRERGDWQREKVGFRLTELNLSDLRKVPVPVPSCSEQDRIVGELNAIRAEIDTLKRLQVETAAELDALLPSILDRAFRVAL